MSTFEAGPYCRGEQRGASEYMSAEDTMGTLEPDKYADFAVFDKDFFPISIEKIPDLKVAMTGLNGKIVYDGRPSDSGR